MPTVVSRPSRYFRCNVTPTLSALQQATCGNANGVVRAQPSGGTAPIPTVWTGAFQANNILSTFQPLHTVVVKDAVGCTATATITITNSVTEPRPPMSPLPFATPLPCTRSVGTNQESQACPPVETTTPLIVSTGRFHHRQPVYQCAPGLHVVTAKTMQAVPSVSW